MSDTPRTIRRLSVLCAYCVERLMYANTHSASLITINGAAIPVPTNVQTVCEELLSGKVVAVNTRLMNRAVTMVGDYPVCPYCLVEVRNKRLE